MSLGAPKPRLSSSPELLGPGQSLALVLAGEDHALPALFHAGTHDSYELAGRLTYDGFLA
jgi:hypothetical protein